MIGVQVGTAPDDGTQLADYVAAAGRRPAMVMWFQGFGGPLYWPRQVEAVDAVRAVPVISWDPILRSGQAVPFTSIAMGTWDPYLRQSAALARAYGKPLYVRFAHEMNLPTSPFGPGRRGNTPASFIAAWRHVVTIFHQQLATNVIWVWAPDVNWAGKDPFQDLYPGDAYVDWVGLDGYNDGKPWKSLTTVFGTSHDQMVALTNKPMMFAETASTERGGDKAAWIRSAFLQELPTRFPDVRAVIWFDRIKEADWRVNSSPAALAAWRAVVANLRYAVG